MRKSHQAIVIDSVNRTFREIRVKRLEDLQTSVGGYIAQALTFPNGDGLLVNDEGLLFAEREGDDNPFHHFFMIKGYPQPLAGNGVLVPDIDQDGNCIESLKTSIQDLESIITFKHIKDLDLDFHELTTPKVYTFNSMEELVRFKEEAITRARKA